MKQIAIGLLILFVLGIGIYVLRTTQRGDDGRAGTDADVQFTMLFADACRSADPATGGPAWPEMDVMRELRTEWQKLGAADSARLDMLAQQWLYPASQEPYRLTDVTKLRGGKSLPLEERLRLGTLLAENPRWKLGSMAHFPAAAAVLNTTEKSILQYLATGGADRPRTIAELNEVLRLFPDALEKAADDLASVGWLTVTGGGDGEESEDDAGDDKAYAVTDPAVVEGGAMQFVVLLKPDGNTLLLPSLQSAFQKHRTSLSKGRVTLAGPCAATGLPVVMSFRDGKLQSGKPGTAWAVTLTRFGATNGVFSSEEAFETWKAAHSGLQLGEGQTLAGFLGTHLANS